MFAYFLFLSIFCQRQKIAPSPLSALIISFTTGATEGSVRSKTYLMNWEMGEPRGGGRDNIRKLKPTTELRLSCRLIGSGWADYDNLQRATKYGLMFHFANGWGQGSYYISLLIDFLYFQNYLCGQRAA